MNFLENGSELQQLALSQGGEPVDQREVAVQTYKHITRVQYDQLKNLITDIQGGSTNLTADSSLRNCLVTSSLIFNDIQRKLVAGLPGLTAKTIKLIKMVALAYKKGSGEVQLTDSLITLANEINQMEKDMVSLAADHQNQLVSIGQAMLGDNRIGGSVLSAYEARVVTAMEEYDRAIEHHDKLVLEMSNIEGDMKYYTALIGNGEDQRLQVQQELEELRKSILEQEQNLLTHRDTNTTFKDQFLWFTLRSMTNYQDNGERVVRETLGRLRRRVAELENRLQSSLNPTIGTRELAASQILYAEKMAALEEAKRNKMALFRALEDARQDVLEGCRSGGVANAEGLLKIEDLFTRTKVMQLSLGESTANLAKLMQIAGDKDNAELDAQGVIQCALKMVAFNDAIFGTRDREDVMIFMANKEIKWWD